MCPLELGQQYAYRESRTKYGEPVSPVKVIKIDPKVKGKVRVVHLEGDYSGLQEWVPKIRLIVPWSESAALCSDEENALVAADISSCSDRTVLGEAVGSAFSGAYDICKNEYAFIGWTGLYCGLLCIRDFDEAVGALALDRGKLLAQSGAFVDRNGQYVAPFSTAVWLAQDLCEKFATQIAFTAHRHEEDLCRKKAEAYEDWKIRFYEEELALQRQANGLIRQWCSATTWNEVDEHLVLLDEIRRLHKLVKIAIQSLEAKQLTADANRLRKQLEGSNDHASRRRARNDRDE